MKKFERNIEFTESQLHNLEGNERYWFKIPVTL